MIVWTMVLDLYYVIMLALGPLTLVLLHLVSPWSLVLGLLSFFQGKMIVNSGKHNTP